MEPCKLIYYTQLSSLYKASNRNKSLNTRVTPLGSYTGAHSWSARSTFSPSYLGKQRCPMLSLPKKTRWATLEERIETTPSPRRRKRVASKLRRTEIWTLRRAVYFPEKVDRRVQLQLQLLAWSLHFAAPMAQSQSSIHQRPCDPEDVTAHLEDSTMK